ncbi:unnamed protein product [Mesocestoides corti]|uniref:CUB domain-containing protein n=1 Tax=Mesocestoides corti TaxID=53468 RepID=A0A0R3U153_MESCO|nr:unnamed protein product [Mesocestoides corti]
MLTTDNSIDAKGFKLTWTKLLPLDENGEGGVAYSYIHIGMGILLTIVLLACLTLYVVYRERRRKRKKIHDPLDNIAVDEDYSDNVYSSFKGANTKTRCSPSLKSFVDDAPPAFHHCHHLSRSQAHLPAHQNGGTVDPPLCRHHSLHRGLSHTHLPGPAPQTFCVHSSNHSIKSHLHDSPVMSSSGLGSGVDCHHPTCPRGHPLVLIPSPPLPPQSSAYNEMQPLHNHIHSPRVQSYEGKTREKTQKISIV